MTEGQKQGVSQKPQVPFEVQKRVRPESQAAVLPGPGQHEEAVGSQLATFQDTQALKSFVCLPSHLGLPAHFLSHKLLPISRRRS